MQVCLDTKRYRYAEQTRRDESERWDVCCCIILLNIFWHALPPLAGERMEKEENWYIEWRFLWDPPRCSTFTPSGCYVSTTQVPYFTRKSAAPHACRRMFAATNTPIAAIVAHRSMNHATMLATNLPLVLVKLTLLNLCNLQQLLLLSSCFDL